MLLRSFVALIVPGMLVLPALCGAEDTENAGDRISCSNERYEDFMRLQHERDKLATDRQRYADEIKGIRAESAKREEVARRGYKRERKADDSKAEALYLAEQKAVKEQQKLIERRFVMARDELSKSRCRGLKIPELKEYDLEDY